MNRIRPIRLAQKMSLKRLSELTSIHYVNLGRYERGERGLDLNVAARIAAALGCTVDELISKDSA